MYDLIIRDATLVSSTGRSVADVAIKGGQIAYVGPRPPRRAKEELSGMGKFLMPGVIDTAVQFDPSDDSGVWERESRAAVTGGVTTVLALPGGHNPVIDAATAKKRTLHASHGSWTNWALWGAANGTNAADLDAAHRDGLIIAALAYLGERADGLNMNANRLDQYLSFAGTVGVQLDFDEATAAEPSGARELLEAAQAMRPIHLVHLSTAAELHLLDPVRGALPVTAGCTPHHLFLSNDETPIRTSPPVRGERDRRREEGAAGPETT